ncbi:MAG: PTS fructose transporter subunit IIA [Candidatus Eisenbacteria bacterium]|nr:PTS fructose transporter subunit IIA [Candidatus Latescibacterota bacterium]MBD3303057.1 PTS fructose transporter subunit IIA [Candidatus Eisenbacteria bacterium]
MADGSRILRYLDERFFVRDLKAKTKDGVLKELADYLSKDREVRDPRLLLEMLKKRESLGSTAIGSGVAIPHGRSLAIANIKVLFARHKKGIDFEAPDEEPVRLFFLIVAPPQDTNNEYLPLLGQIAELVKEPAIRDRLIEAQTYADLAQVLEGQGS